MTTTTASERKARTQRVARSIAYLINVRSVCMCALACAAVGVCEWFDVKFALDASVVVFGVTFSVTFTITQAYQRRERALIAMAELKASVIALYWQHRDWPQDGDQHGYPASIGDDTSPWAREFASVALDFLANVQKYMRARDGYESIAEVRLAAKRNATASLLFGDTEVTQRDLAASFVARVQDITTALPSNVFLMRAYGALSKMSAMGEYLTHKAGYSRGGEGGLSRSAQYLRFLIAQMEQLRMIKIYRTPAMLRHACGVLIHALTIVLAPYFLHAGACDADYRFAVCPAPFIMACLWVLVTQLLLTVQESNEHPLDGADVDDVFLELGEEFGDVLADAAWDYPINDSGKCFDAWRRSHGSSSGKATEQGS